MELLNQFLLWFLEHLSRLVLKLISMLSSLQGKIADKMFWLRINNIKQWTKK